MIISVLIERPNNHYHKSQKCPMDQSILSIHPISQSYQQLMIKYNLIAYYISSNPIDHAMSSHPIPSHTMMMIHPLIPIQHENFPLLSLTCIHNSSSITMIKSRYTAIRLIVSIKVTFVIIIKVQSNTNPITFLVPISIPTIVSIAIPMPSVTDSLVSL